MSAYATTQTRLRSLASEPVAQPAATLGAPELSSLAGLVDQLVERVAATVVARLARGDAHGDEWFDSRHAAEYLGVHRDTLRKLAAERSIPSEQAGPGCKLYFRRSDLDVWRHGGGRPRHLAAALRHAA
jgi:excisionase family DNA binding protein